MSKNAEIIKVVLQEVKKQTGQLDNVKTAYIHKQLGKADLSNITPKNIYTLIDFIKKEISDKKKMDSFAIATGMDELDIHEHIRREIANDGGDGGDGEAKAIHPDTIANITSILGITTPTKLLSSVNPQALIEKTYLVLDRRYTDRNSSTNQYFKWYLSTENINTGSGIAYTKIQLQNIVAIKMYAFKFPNTANTLTHLNRLSVSIDELTSQAFVAQENNRKYHFLFDLAKQVDTATTPYLANDVGRNVTEFKFSTPITYLNTVTLSFGNPFQLLTLYPDALNATISSSGGYARLTFTTDHNLLVDDVVNISGFTTDTPTVDTALINQMNEVNGIEVRTVVSSTIVDIEVPLTGTGAILNNPYEIYLQSKRFAIHLEISYIKQV